MRTFSCLLVSLSILGLSACSSDTSTKSPAPVSDGGSLDGKAVPKFDFTAFDAAVEAFLKENHLPGASGVIVHKDYGMVHVAGYGSFAADRLYLIASSSKVMSVGVIMRLADQGLLDLDTPISTYLSAWGTHKTDITLAEMLSNSSGMVGLVDNPFYVPYICQYVSSGTLSDCAKLIYTANDAADLKKPDTEFHYGGGQWQLAGGIAEVVSGKTWKELVEETYGTPCDVPSIGYTNQYEEAATSGAGADAGGDGGSLAAALSYPRFFKQNVANLPVTDNPSIEGGAYTNAEDYGKILLMHLRGGLCGKNRVLSEKAVARMQVDRIKEAYDGTTTLDPTLKGYGLGWWIDRDHPGVVGDAGAYGAMPWLDLPRGYGAFLVLEDNATVGTALRVAVKPVLDKAFDDAAK
jgi:CubicO group peptidase (beta-lactamase class C family)